MNLGLSLRLLKYHILNGIKISITKQERRKEEALLHSPLPPCCLLSNCSNDSVFDTLVALGLSRNSSVKTGLSYWLLIENLLALLIFILLQTMDASLVNGCISDTWMLKYAYFHFITFFLWILLWILFQGDGCLYC